MNRRKIIEEIPAKLMLLINAIDRDSAETHELLEL